MKDTVISIVNYLYMKCLPHDMNYLIYFILAMNNIIPTRNCYTYHIKHTVDLKLGYFILLELIIFVEKKFQQEVYNQKYILNISFKYSYSIFHLLIACIIIRYNKIQMFFAVPQQGNTHIFYCSVKSKTFLLTNKETLIKLIVKLNMKLRHCNSFNCKFIDKYFKQQFVLL